MLRVGVLASGYGSNLQALLDACASGAVPARVVVVASNVADAHALVRAREAGVAAVFVDPRAHAGREAYDAALVETLRAHGAELVCLAGYMRIVSGVMLRAFPQRVLNIHPALLPAFPGLHAQRQALQHGARVSGCTVHLVDEGVDTGPIVAQAAVPVYADDTEETLSDRIIAEEHKLYPRTVKWFAEGRVRVEGRRVTIEGATSPAAAFSNPHD
jgi:phosphoribosylglycinamide formyltransferase-1